MLLGATLIAALDSEAVAAVLDTIVNTLSSLITLPLFAAVLTVIYFDLRVRKEGFDLQLLARGVGGDAPTSAETWPPRAGWAVEGRGYAPPAQGGGFAPPRPRPGAARVRPPSRRLGPPRPPGGLQSGDPLASPPPERREDDGGAAS